MPQILKSRRGLIGAGFLLLLALWLVLALVHTNQRQQVFTGLGSGTFIAAIALVVILNYRGSGVVNFAAGAMAMYFGYIYAGLRNHGVLLIPPLPNPLAPIEGIAHLAGSSVHLPHWHTTWQLNGGH